MHNMVIVYVSCLLGASTTVTTNNTTSLNARSVDINSLSPIMTIGYTKDWIRLSSPSPSWLSQIHLPNHDQMLVSFYNYYVT